MSLLVLLDLSAVFDITNHGILLYYPCWDGSWRHCFARIFICYGWSWSVSVHVRNIYISVNVKKWKEILDFNFRICKRYISSTMFNSVDVSWVNWAVSHFLHSFASQWYFVRFLSLWLHASFLFALSLCPGNPIARKQTLTLPIDIFWAAPF